MEFINTFLLSASILSIAAAWFALGMKLIDKANETKLYVHKVAVVIWAIFSISLIVAIAATGK